METTEIETRVFEFADKLAEKLTLLAEKHGPEVVETALAVARVSAAKELFTAAVLAGAAVFLGRTALSLGRTAGEIVKERGERYYSSIEVTYGMGAAGSAFVAGICGIIAIDKGLNLWNWVGVFEPSLWIAQRILNW